MSRPGMHPLSDVFFRPSPYGNNVDAKSATSALLAFSDVASARAGTWNSDRLADCMHTHARTHTHTHTHTRNIHTKNICKMISCLKHKQETYKEWMNEWMNEELMECVGVGMNQPGCPGSGCWGRRCSRLSLCRRWSRSGGARVGRASHRPGTECWCVESLFVFEENSIIKLDDMMNPSNLNAC